MKSHSTSIPSAHRHRSHQLLRALHPLCLLFLSSLLFISPARQASAIQTNATTAAPRCMALQELSELSSKVVAELSDLLLAADEARRVGQTLTAETIFDGYEKKLLAAQADGVDVREVEARLSQLRAEQSADRGQRQASQQALSETEVDELFAGWTREYQLDLDKAKVTGIEFSPDSQKIVVATSLPNLSNFTEFNNVSVWDVASGTKLYDLDQQAGKVENIVFNPDGNSFITISECGRAFIWNAQTGAQLHHLPGEYLSKISATVSADGLFVYLGYGNTISVWNLQTSQVEKQWNFLAPNRFIRGADHDSIQSIQLSQDGGRLLIAASNRVAVWDVRTGQPLKDFTKMRGQLREGARWTPDESQVIMYGNGPQVWDINAEKEMDFSLQLGGHIAAAVRPDGLELAVQPSKGNLYRWSTVTASEVEPKFEAAETQMRELEYDSTGRLLLAKPSSSIQGVRIIDAQSGITLREFSTASDARLSPGAKALATHSGRGRIRLWIR